MESSSPADPSRRRFLQVGVVGAASLTLGHILAQENVAMANPAAENTTASVIRIRPRYARLGVDAGLEQIERNCHYGFLDWQVPVAQCAMICLDVWNEHYCSDVEQRMDDIARRRIAPLLASCREHGLQVIHVPGPPIVQKSPNWLRMIDESARPQPEYPDSPQWPPAEFRARKGAFAQYARPVESYVGPAAVHRDTRRDFHPMVRPAGDEPVILSGEELHRYCARRGILHLFYVGFLVNVCMISRTYSLKNMMDRGYHGILLRDCTTGREIADTVDGFVCTRGTIANFEQRGAYTLESTELADALKSAVSSS